MFFHFLDITLIALHVARSAHGVHETKILMVNNLLYISTTIYEL